MANEHACDDPERAREIMSSNAFVLVDMSTTWCEPCTVLARRLENVRKKYPSITIINVDKEVMRNDEKRWLETLPCLKQAYELPGIPVLVFIKNGNVIGEHLDQDQAGHGLYWGLVSEKTIVQTLKKHDMI